MGKYQFCILNDNNDIIEYEKLLFQYYGKNLKNWITKNFEIIDGRLRAPISYSDKLVFAVKKDNKIVSGMGAHINPNNQFFCEKIGFYIEKNENTCEGLTAFVTDDEIWNIDLFIYDFVEYIQVGMVTTFTVFTWVAFHVCRITKVAFKSNWLSNRYPLPNLSCIFSV